LSVGIYHLQLSNDEQLIKNQKIVLIK